MGTPRIAVSRRCVVPPAAGRRVGAEPALPEWCAIRSGAVLPGVTVEAASPALIEKVRVGRDRQSGRCTASSISGPVPTPSPSRCPASTRSGATGIELRAEFTATVDAELAVGTLEETITVSGEAPLVDTRSARAQTQYASETLQALPGTGRLSTLISVLPGAVLNNEGDRASGNLSDRSQTRFAIHGAPNAQPVIDGMNTEMAASNTGVFVWNSVNFQEVVAETSGIGADRDTGGMQLNMIPKDGGNVFSGTANIAYSGPDLQSNNINDELIARGLDSSTRGLSSIKKFIEASGGLGGPIKQNKLWFFGAARKSVTQQYAAGIYWNAHKQPESMLYVPDLSRPAHSNDFYRDYSLRLTVQATEKHKFVVSGSFQRNCNCVYALFRPQGGPLVTPEAATEHEYEPNFNVTTTWTYPATNRLLLMFAGGANHITQTNRRGAGVDENSIQITEQSLDLKYGAAYGADGRRVVLFDAASPAVPPAVLGDLCDRVAQLQDRPEHPGGQNGQQRQVRRRPVHGQSGDSLYVQPPAPGVAAAAGDADPFRGIGQRHRGLRAGSMDDPAADRESGASLQRRRYVESGTGAPARVLRGRAARPGGGAHPALAESQPACRRRLRSVWRRQDGDQGFVRPLPGHHPRVAGEPGQPVFARRPTGPGTTRCSAPAIGGAVTSSPTASCSTRWRTASAGAWSDQNFGRQRLSTRNAPDSLEGFNKQFHNWQASVTFQHELTQGLALNVGYFRTWYGGFQATDNEAVPAPADYDSYCVTAPTDSPAAGWRWKSDLRPVRRQAGALRSRRQPGDPGVELWRADAGVQRRGSRR